MSNFTDFTPFELEPDIKIRKISKTKELSTPDLIIIPGSKNVISDLKFLKATGLDQAIIKAVNNNSFLIGICGGLQICGESIEDPYHIESTAHKIKGLNLLPLKTIIAKEKQLQRTKARWNKYPETIEGYEIHHGITKCADNKFSNIKCFDHHPVGFSNDNIWTTYLHGVFDNDKFRRFFINRIRINHNLPPLKKIVAVYDTDSELNRLADVVRDAIDMKKIYKIMGLK